MKHILHIISALLFISCSQPQQTDTTATGQNDGKEKTAVSKKTAEAQSDSLSTNSTVSKGNIESLHNIPVYCQLEQLVTEKRLKEGMHVEKGQTLLVLDDEDLRTALTQARNELEQAQYLYDETLIGQGYKRNEFDNVPENVKATARVKSGYNICKENLEHAQRQYAKRIVSAPVSGTVTEVNIQQYDMSKRGEPICRILDTEHTKVVFHILETELQRVTIGTKVRVRTIAFSKDIHTATVSVISPVVNQNGMVRIEAIMDDCKNLMPGMTAFVNI